MLSLSCALRFQKVAFIQLFVFSNFECKDVRHARAASAEGAVFVLDPVGQPRYHAEYSQVVI
jgi:hypothetical protein